MVRPGRRWITTKDPYLRYSIAYHLDCISSNSSDNRYCTVYRMNDCRADMLHFLSLDQLIDHVIDHTHRVLGLPKFAN